MKLPQIVLILVLFGISTIAAPALSEGSVAHHSTGVSNLFARAGHDKNRSHKKTGFVDNSASRSGAAGAIAGVSGDKTGNKKGTESHGRKRPNSEASTGTDSEGSEGTNSNERKRPKHKAGTGTNSEGSGGTKSKDSKAPAKDDFNCAGPNAQVCRNMCYAALCNTHSGTGIKLSGKEVDTTALSASQRASQTRAQSIGTGNNAQKIASMKSAGVTVPDIAPSNLQLDEWPPIASEDGGDGACVLPVTKQGSQGTAIRQAISGDGFITLTGFANIKECQFLEKKDKSKCGTLTDFAQLKSGSTTEWKIAFSSK